MLLRLRFAVVNIKWDMYDSETARTHLCHSKVMISEQFQWRCDWQWFCCYCSWCGRGENAAQTAPVCNTPHQTQIRLEKVPFLICMKKCPYPPHSPPTGASTALKKHRGSQGFQKSGNKEVEEVHRAAHSPLGGFEGSGVSEGMGLIRLFRGYIIPLRSKVNSR